MYQNVDDRQDSDKLTVEFYRKLWHNPTKSIDAGRPIYEEKEWVKIAVPGNPHLLIDTLVDETHQLRFPARYQKFKEATSDDVVVNGTPLAQWPAVTRDQAEALRYMKFMTVEQIAGASDHQLQAIGMKVGMSPWEFQKLAKAFLDASKRSADQFKNDARFELMQADNDDLRAQNIDQGEKIKELERQISVLAQNVVAGSRKPRSPRVKEPD